MHLRAWAILDPSSDFFCVRSGNKTLRAVKQVGRERRFSVAKDFDLHSNDQGKNCQRPPGRRVIPFNSVRRGRHDFLPIATEKAEPRAEAGVSRPGFRPRRLAGVGPIFLLGIAIACGLYARTTYKASIASSLKSEEQLRPGPTSQPSSPEPSLSKPSSKPPVVTARAEGSIMPEHAPNAVSNLPGSAALHYHPVKYEATHKKVFGSCTGQLELTSARLHFRCPHEADLNIPVGSIAKAHKDGVVLESGEKYHFLIANHTKGQVEAIFALWLKTVQEFQQPRRQSSS